MNNIIVGCICLSVRVLRIELPPFQDDDGYIMILGSFINGIFCLFCGHTTPPVLWNPTTEEFKAIPYSLVEFERPYRDPLVTHCGFGYDHVRDDYKVIRYVVFFFLDAEYLEHFDIPYDGPWDVENISFEPLWKIYSLRSNSWKKLDLEMPEPCDIRVGSQAYTEGVCHWWGTQETPELFFVSCLVSFDMSNEVFFTMPIPSYMGDASFDLLSMEVHLAVLNGYVAFICNPAEKTTFHISMLGEVGVKESWTKLFVIGPFPCIENLIGADNNGDIFFKTKDGELAWFDWSRVK